MQHVRVENKGTAEAVPVDIVAGGAGNGAILDGVDNTLKATVVDLTNANPLTVAIVDGSGDQITSFGGGTQYTEGDTDASITGTVALMEVAGNTLQPIQGTVADGLLVNLGSNNDVTVAGVATAAKQDTAQTALDAIQAAVETIDNAISGSEMQVDVVTMPTTTVQATNLDIRDLSSGSDSVAAVQSGSWNVGLNAGTNNIGDVDVLTLPDVTLAAGTNTNEVVGDVADDAPAAGNPLGIGLVARTTNRTAVADGDAVRAVGDDLGRTVVAVGQVRDLVNHQHTQIASSSSETTIITATGAGTFADLTQLVITNQTATAVNVTIKDATAGTTRLIVAIAASGGAVISFPRPVKQASANNNWTATLSSAAVTVNIFAQFEVNV